MKVSIIGWCLLALTLADAVFTYADNRFGNPPSPVTSWIMDGDWGLACLIIGWEIVLVGSILMIQSGHPPGTKENQEPAESENEHSARNH